MRCLLALAALAAFAAGCSGVPVNGPQYESVRERMSEVPTWLFVRDEASSGTVTARGRGADGDLSASTELAVQRGYVRARVDELDQLEIDRLEIVIAPITLDGMLHRTAQLQDVRLRASAPVRGEATWTSANDATATLVVPLALDWAIAFDGGETFTAATQRLPPQSIDVVISGDGDHVVAWLDVEATGVLWSWADLVQITELALSVTAETAD